MYGVVLADGFADTRREPRLIGVERGEAADIHRPEVHGRLAGVDPFGQGLAGAAGAGDAHGIHAGADKEVPDLGRLAEDEVGVRREAFGPVHQLAHLGGLERRHADEGVRHQDLELVPVLVQQGELEAIRDAVHAPGLGLGLEPAHDEAADFLLEVDRAVGIAQHRQIGGDAVDLLGDDVHMLGRIKRHRDAAHAPHLPPPLAGAVDDDVTGDGAVIGRDPGDGAAHDVDAGDLDPLEDLDAAGARALGQRLGHVRRVDLAVARDPDAADEVVGAHQRP